MQTHIQKWGNSLAVRLPIQFARQLHFEPGTIVDISLEDHHLLIKTQQETLEHLLSQITSENLHGEVFEDDGPQGQEIW